MRLQSTPEAHALILEVLLWQARLQLGDGDLAGTSRTLDSRERIEHELAPLQQQRLHLLHARALLAQDQPETALPLLERLLCGGQQNEHVIQALEIRLLMALAYAASKQRQEARQQLMCVLREARAAGFVRLFLDEGEPLAALLRQLLPSLRETSLHAYAQTLLQATASRPGSPASSAVTPYEPLSGREQQVLRLLVAGRSAPEIASELVVSLNTVKTQIQSIYRKLNVHNRVEASEAARRLALL